MKYLYKISKRNLLYLLFDLFIINVSYLLSYVLRFYPSLTRELVLIGAKYFVILSLSYILPFYAFQAYRIMWEYSNIRDIYKLSIANVVGFLIFIGIIFPFSLEYSRLLFILTFFFVLVGSIFYRVLIRDYFSKKKNAADQLNQEDLIQEGSTRNMLLVGAGEAGRTILSEYSKIGIAKNIVGFVDDDREKIGKIFNGKMILAPCDEITDVISKYDIDEVIICMPSASSESINRIVLTIKREFKKVRNIKIRTLPSLLEVLDSRPLIGSLREIGIDDLIGREEIKVDNRAIERSFSEKVILVTGAGGSIGSELCRQLLKFRVKRLIAVGRGEFSIYELIKNLNEYISYLDYRPDVVFKIADIKDFDLLQSIYQRYKPDVVFHAAAHKHVPLMEFNEAEAIQNNIVGTLNVLKLSVKFNIEKFVLISTDKAVNPVSIMGATKRIAEVFTLRYYREEGLRATIVRFGNVIGSRGSVIPLFQEQIEKGGPITVTDPEMKRYFMTIPEASILVINASAYAKGGDILVLDMGRQYKVLDIAKNLIRFYGYEPDKDIKIKFTGLRPGEKLYEELFYDKESLEKTEHEKIYILKTADEFYNGNAIDDFINSDLKRFAQYDSSKIRESLKKVVKDYTYGEYKDYSGESSKFIS